MTTTTTEESNGSNKLTKRDAIQKASESIELAISECGVMAVKDQPAFMQAIRMAHGIKTIRGALTEQFVKESFMPLQNSALGFLTDKPDGYSWDVVRDVLCEALLRGFRPVGNEFNIIAGRFYGAKAGFERIVLEFPGLQDLRINMGVPVLVQDKGALVPCEATWVFAGKPDSITCAQVKDGIDSRIPVRVNSGMGMDAILGKATRKLFARIYQRLTGCSRDVIDADLDEVPRAVLPAVAEPAQDGRRISMRGGKKATEEPRDEEPAIDNETGEVLPAEREPGSDG